MHKYLAIVFFTAVSLLTAIAVANYLVNPYLVFAAPAWHGINEVITESFYKQPLFKPYQLRALQPRSVILGSSPAGIALDPDKLPAPAYNLAIGGATSYMNYRLLQEALATSPQLQQVILEMPFFAFNSDDPNNQANLDSEFEQRLSLQADGAPNRALPLFVCRDQLDTLVTWDVSRASFRTLLKQQRVSEKKKGSYIQFRNGQWTQQFPAGQSTYAIIEGSWKKFLYNDWFPAPHYTFTLTNNEQNDPLDYYRQSLRLLYAHNIHTQLVIAPVHGSLLLAQQAAGLQIDFFRWKKFLVEINAAEAARAGKPPFELVDYATINAYTTEALPLEKQNKRLQWFLDAGHASPALGELMLRELHDSHFEIGKLLTAENVDNAIQQQALANYQQQNLALQAAIEALVAKAPPEIHYAR